VGTPFRFVEIRQIHAESRGAMPGVRNHEQSRFSTCFARENDKRYLPGPGPLPGNHMASLDRCLSRTLAPCLLVIATAGVASAQRAGDSSLLTVERIYDPREFSVDGFGPSRWLDD